MSSKLWLICSLVSSSCLFSQLTSAQVIPDGTTPTNLIGNCFAKCDVIGGIRADSNLFHSFQEFNIVAGESLYFSDPGVANIFTRVTGNNSSSIFGKLGVTGNANLWLLNPQGIIFGNGATLDINGSFFSATAEEIVFGDRGSFSSNPEERENLSLLTVNPSAFFSEQIAQLNPIALEGANLTVPQQESIILLGGQNNLSQPGITLRNVQIIAPQGNIQLASAASPGKVEISPELQLKFPDDLIQGDITISQDSLIDISGIKAGRLQLQGAEIRIRDSFVSAVTLGNLDGGKINISADRFTLNRGTILSRSLGAGKGADISLDAKAIDLQGNGSSQYQTLIGESLNGTVSPDSQFAGILTVSEGKGAAGDILFHGNHFSATEGTILGSLTYGEGNGGNVRVKVPANIELDSSALISFSAVDSLGDTGKISIDTQNLLISKGSIISTATLGSGDGENISIEATDSIELRETPANSIFPTTIFTNSAFENMGKAGNIRLETKKLTVRDGSQISSASGLLNRDGILPLGGVGGDIDIEATNSVTISGNSPDNLFASGITSDTRTINSAGNINIKTGKFSLVGQGFSSASSLGLGNGGNLSIDASEFIQLNGAGIDNFFRILSDASLENLSLETVISRMRSGLFSLALQESAGNITLNSPQISLENGSFVSASTIGVGQGGNIDLKAAETLEIISSIVANSSLGAGNAGNITIDSHDLILRNGGTIATSTIGFGRAGSITINATELVELTNENHFTLPFSGGIFTSNQGLGAESAGNLSINTKQLIIRDGLTINIANQIPALAFESEITPAAPSTQTNQSTIEATESIEITGRSANNLFISSIDSSTETDIPANNLKIVTPQLTLADGGNISVSSSGGGAAASLDIIADRLVLSSGGTLNANTVSGEGGDISLVVADLVQLSDRSNITTNALNRGNGGNINIKTNFLITFPESQITANAIAGRGGNINIMAKDIFVSSHNQISASSQLGIDGEVNISTFSDRSNREISQLPKKTLAKEQKIVSLCSFDENLGTGSFVYIGKGALTPDLLEGYFSHEKFLVDWGDESTEFELHSTNQQNNSSIVEATGWEMSSDGNIVLTARNSPLTISPFEQTECPFAG